MGTRVVTGLKAQAWVIAVVRSGQPAAARSGMGAGCEEDVDRERDLLDRERDVR